MDTAWRRLWPACVGLVCLALPGCMQVPLCILEINYVRPVDPGPASAEVHAYRVAVTVKEVVNIEADFQPAAGGVDHFELTPMRLPDHGTTAAQLDLTWAYGWRFIGVWNHWPTLTTHAVLVRLYRRGYETIELRPGQNEADLVWHPATEVAALETAVDNLLGVSPLLATSPLDPVKTTGHRSPPALELGTVSSGHREALLFAAGEYEWLAEQLGPAGEHQAIHRRLVEKASRLKDLAAGKVEVESQPNRR
jgi:hypothetical protein